MSQIGFNKKKDGGSGTWVLMVISILLGIAGFGLFFPDDAAYMLKYITGINPEDNTYREYNYPEYTYPVQETEQNRRKASGDDGTGGNGSTSGGSTSGNDGISSGSSTSVGNTSGGSFTLDNCRLAGLCWSNGYCCPREARYWCEGGCYPSTELAQMASNYRCINFRSVC